MVPLETGKQPALTTKAFPKVGLIDTAWTTDSEKGFQSKISLENVIWSMPLGVVIHWKGSKKLRISESWRNIIE